MVGYNEAQRFSGYVKIGKKKVAEGLREAEFFISYFHHIPCYVELGSDSDFTIA
jgi:hypothetical protein